MSVEDSNLAHVTPITHFVSKSGRRPPSLTCAEPPRSAQRFHFSQLLFSSFFLDLHFRHRQDMWQESSYGASSSSAQPQSYYQAAPSNEPLQFYGGGDPYAYPGSRPSLDTPHDVSGHMAVGGGPQGSISHSPSFGGNIQSQGGWWTAFGTGGFEGEPPLLEGVCRHHVCL